MIEEKEVNQNRKTEEEEFASKPADCRPYSFSHIFFHRSFSMRTLLLTNFDVYLFIFTWTMRFQIRRLNFHLTLSFPGRSIDVHCRRQKILPSC